MNFVQGPHIYPGVGCLKRRGRELQRGCSQALRAQTLDLAQELLASPGRKVNRGHGRIGDHPPGTHKTVREPELETCLRLISSTQDHDQEDRWTLADF
jgi:hypothetical protein